METKDKLVSLLILKKLKKKINLEKQDKLISGTNIKTINGLSILGNGDLSVVGSIGIQQDSDNEKAGVVANTTAAIVDESLTYSGLAADAKVTGDKISEINENITKVANDITLLDKSKQDVITDPPTLDAGQELLTRLELNTTFLQMAVETFLDILESGIAQDDVGQLLVYRMNEENTLTEEILTEIYERGIMQEE